jgi:hypothetical protein
MTLLARSLFIPLTSYCAAKRDSMQLIHIQSSEVGVSLSLSLADSLLQEELCRTHFHPHKWSSLALSAQRPHPFHRARAPSAIFLGCVASRLKFLAAHDIYALYNNFM